MKGYPRYFQPWFWFVCAALLLTGLLLVPTMLVMRFEMDVPWRLSGDARLVVATLHATAAFVMLVVCGALWSVHMRSGWWRKLQRISGSLLVALMLVLALTALGIYYFGDAALADGAALIHVVASLAITVPLAWHVVKGRRIQRKSVRHPFRPPGGPAAQRHKP